MKSLVKLLFIFSLLFISLTGCKKKKKEVVTVETGTVTDIDNNVYQTRKIGDLWWMTENLKVKHYRNGITIPSVTLTDPDTVWAHKTTASYCSYKNNATNVDKFGLLYNYYAVSNANNIAPAGWHVATDDEWKQLESYLGMTDTERNKSNWRGTNEGDKLKLASPNGWTTYGAVWSTNESGFSASGGSCRLQNGTWGDPGTFATGFWWTSSSHQIDNEAWFRYLDYKESRVYRYHVPKTYGMSIRCVKD